MVTKKWVGIGLALSFMACAPEVRLASNSSASQAEATVQLKIQQDKTNEVKATLTRVKDSLSPFATPLSDLLAAVNSTAEAQTKEAAKRINDVLARLLGGLGNPLQGSLIRYGSTDEWSAESRLPLSIDRIVDGIKVPQACTGAIRIEGHRLTTDSELILLGFRDCYRTTTNLAVFYVTKDSVQTYFDLSGMSQTAMTMADVLSRFNKRIDLDICKLTLTNENAELSCSPFKIALPEGTANIKKLDISSVSTDFKAQAQIEILDADGKHISESDLDTTRSPKFQYNGAH